MENEKKETESTNQDKTIITEQPINITILFSGVMITVEKKKKNQMSTTQKMRMAAKKCLKLSD